MKRKPHKSILLLIGYLLLLMVLFNVYAIKADRFDSDKETDFSHQRIQVEVTSTTFKL